NVHVAEISEHQSARDGRCRKHEHVHRMALTGERKALVHAKAMLLVDDRESEIVKGDLLLKQRMGADKEIDVAEGQSIENILALIAAFAAGQDSYTKIGGLGERRNGVEMLTGEYYGRRHERCLPACLDHGCGG